MILKMCLFINQHLVHVEYVSAWKSKGLFKTKRLPLHDALLLNTKRLDVK